MPLLTESPRGDERSKIRRTDPSGLGADPIGEQWVCGKGGKGNGPDVWPLVTSFSMASLTFSGLLIADRRLRGLELSSLNDPLKPMSNPCLNPEIKYLLVVGHGYCSKYLSRAGNFIGVIIFRGNGQNG